MIDFYSHDEQVYMMHYLICFLAIPYFKPMGFLIWYFQLIPKLASFWISRLEHSGLLRSPFRIRTIPLKTKVISSETPSSAWTEAFLLLVLRDPSSQARLDLWHHRRCQRQIKLSSAVVLSVVYGQKAHLWVLQLTQAAAAAAAGGSGL